MMWGDLLDRLGRSFGAGEARPGLSRRDMLSGLGLAAAGLVAGPALLLPDTAAAAELIDGADGLEEDLLEEVQYRRGRGRRRRGRGRRGRARGRRRGRGRARRRAVPRGRRRRFVHPRRRRGPHLRFEFHHAPRRRYAPAPRYSGRHEYWHRQCVRNWGYSNSNYRGCMRYHGAL